MTIEEMTGVQKHDIWITALTVINSIAILWRMGTSQRRIRQGAEKAIVKDLEVHGVREL